MDEQRFDAAVRALGRASSRRAAIGGALGAFFGGGLLEAAAKGPGKGKGTGKGKGPVAEGPCGDGSATANRCTKDAQCCTGYCADSQCRLRPNWMPCKKNEECSSNRCLSGRCDGGCNPAGSRCQENFNCCDGMICQSGRCKKSSKAKCAKSNCPGCCDGTTCRVGESKVACGAGGAACDRCKAGVTCENGSCGTVCTAETCPTGCCLNGACMKGKGSNACGTGGIPCAVCTGSETCKFYLCLGCLSDADCGGETPICDYATGSCVACLSGADCPDCKICLEHACVTVEWSNVTTFGSGPGSTSNQFNAPNGLALSSDDLEVYVSDALNFRIAVWSRPDTTSTSWTPLTTFGSSSDFGLPDGVAISSDKLTAFVPGNVGYVTAWSRPGTTGSDATAWSLQTTIGTASIDNPAADQFNSPRNVFVSPDMLTIYVPDNGLQRISVWSRPGITGSDATAWTHQYNFGDTGTDPSDLIGPEDIILSADGLTAWIGESRGRVSIWTRPDTTTDPSAWTYQMAFGQEESGPGQFEGLGQIAVSPDELTIWITDNTRVSVWSRPDATSSEWTAGTPIGREGSLPCELDLPAGVEVAADGVTIFIADHNNNRISVWKKD